MPISRTDLSTISHTLFRCFGSHSSIAKRLFRSIFPWFIRHSRLGPSKVWLMPSGAIIAVIDLLLHRSADNNSKCETGSLVSVRSEEKAVRAIALVENKRRGNPLRTTSRARRNPECEFFCQDDRAKIIAQAVFNRGEDPTEIILTLGGSVVDAQIVFSRQ
jgi:hypothetical protein